MPAPLTISASSRTAFAMNVASDAWQEMHLDTTTTEIFNRIRNNEISTLELSEYFQDIDGLIDALSENTSIIIVKFSGDFLGCLRGPARTRLIEALGLHLPNLQAVTLADSCLTAWGLTSLVQNARKLKVLILEKIVFQGLQKHFDEFDRAMSQKAQLKDVCMKDCISANRGINLDRILAAGNRMDSSSAINLSGKVSNQVKKSALAA